MNPSSNSNNDNSNKETPENPSLSLSHKEFIVLGMALVDLFMIYPEYRLLVPDLSEKVVNTLNKIAEVKKNNNSEKLQNNDAGDSNVIITVAV